MRNSSKNLLFTAFRRVSGAALRFWQQLGLFLLAEHTVLLLQFTVQFLISEIPKDVEEIGRLRLTV